MARLRSSAPSRKIPMRSNGVTSLFASPSRIGTPTASLNRTQRKHSIALQDQGECSPFQVAQILQVAFDAVIATVIACHVVGKHILLRATRQRVIENSVGRACPPNIVFRLPNLGFLERGSTITTIASSYDSPCTPTSTHVLVCADPEVACIDVVEGVAAFARHELSEVSHRRIFSSLDSACKRAATSINELKPHLPLRYRTNNNSKRNLQLLETGDCSLSLESEQVSFSVNGSGKQSLNVKQSTN